MMGVIVDETVALAVANNSPIKKFFDGTVPAGSTNFLLPANSGRLTTLKAHLVQFFGSALGCDEYGFPAYAGNPDMAAVHKNMPIMAADFDTFNQALLSVLDKYNVPQADQDATLAVLESTRGDICNQCPAGTTDMGSSSTGSILMPLSALVSLFVSYFVVKSF